MNTFSTPTAFWLAATWLGSSAVYADQAPEPVQHGWQQLQHIAQAGDALLAGQPHELGTLSSNLGPGRAMMAVGNARVVTGAPYCADAVHETVQTLADGNRIVRKNATRWCRDGQGRTRQETERGGRPVVYLRDPVAKQGWTLDVQNKTATQVGMMGQQAVDSMGMRAFSERMREWAQGFSQRMREQTPPAVPAKPGAEKSSGNIDPVVISRVPGNDAARAELYDVIRIQSGDAPPAAASPASPPTLPTPPIPSVTPRPPVLGNMHDWMPSGARLYAPRGQGVQTSLGSREFDGVKANGERTTWTIEAGKYGNEKPIVITSEKWVAPELMLTVYARDFDPRSGETVYKLTHLKRGEPEGALFKVPADFKVRESKRSGWHMPRGLRELPLENSLENGE
jgi:hypothetical protein